MSSEVPSLLTRTGSVDGTRSLAGAVSTLAAPGDVVLLAGELGAGKTAFAQGFAAGLGVTEPVVSPTFTIAREYRGRLLVHHLDVYRLDRLSELADVGLAELLDEGAVVLIEWGDAIAPALPAEFLEVKLGFGDGDDDRVLRFRAVGTRWAGRAERLAGVLDPWRGEERG